MKSRAHGYRPHPVAGLFILCLLSLGPPSTGDAAPVCQNGENTLCGVNNAEDLLWLPATGKIIASGLTGAGGSGKLHLVDPATSAVAPLYPGGSPGYRHRSDWFADCPEPPDANNFSAHGLSLLPLGNSLFRLYVVAHGGRESVEVFDIDAGGETPSATWIGCVEFPANDSINSVAALPDGGFYATRISAQSDTFDSSGEATGFLYAWQPGGELTRIAGTDMAYPNGLATTPDGHQVYVASWGGKKIVRFLPGEVWKRDGEAALDFRPDNLRWSGLGQLLTAGQQLDDSGDCPRLFCFTGWQAARIDPDTLDATPIAAGRPRAGFAAATVAIDDRADDGAESYWLGTFNGDRLIRVTAPAPAPPATQ